MSHQVWTDLVVSLGPSEELHDEFARTAIDFENHRLLVAILIGWKHQMTTDGCIKLEPDVLQAASALYGSPLGDLDMPPSVAYLLEDNYEAEDDDDAAAQVKFVFDDENRDFEIGFEPHFAVDLGTDMFEIFDSKDEPRRKRLEARFAYKNPEDRERAIAKFELRQQQRTKTKMQFLARTLNGGKKLHHSITVDRTRPHVWSMSKADLNAYLTKLNGKGATGEEPQGSEQTSPGSTGKRSTHQKGQQQKINKKNLKKGGVNKKEAIIAKNNKIAANKLNDHDDDKSESLKNSWILLVAKYSDQPKEFYAQCLNFGAGPKRILDTFNDFAALGEKLKTREAQYEIALKMLTDMFDGVMRYSLGVFSRPEKIVETRKMVELTVRCCNDIFITFGDMIQPDQIMFIQDVLLSFGFVRTSATLFKAWETKHGKSKAATPLAKPTKKSDFRIKKEIEANFQLEYMNLLFDRTLGSGDDPRVLFRPDAWQKRLLNIVDRKDSALVVAPTASGKTFVVYYAMEQCLRLSDEAVCVFVAPSKALARQVEAEVYSRMGNKTYQRNTKAILSGTMYREYAQNPLKGQILITVPETMEMVLTSLGPKQLDFIKRCQYFIFDEIHCISEQEGGEIYEKLIQMCPCPYLALSATIGNVNEFHHWMELQQKPWQGKVELIEHCERFADLRNMIYSDNLDKQGQLYNLNPFTTLHYEALVNQGLSSDFYVPANDLCGFHEALLTVLDEGGCSEAATLWRATLDPQTYFYGRDNGISVALINKKNYRQYLSDVKAQFMAFINDKTLTEELFNTMCQHLWKATPMTDSSVSTLDWMELKLEKKKRVGKSLGGVVKKEDTEDTLAREEEGFASVGETIEHDKKLEKNPGYLDGARLYQFCKNLDGLGLLPSLVFNFSRTEARTMTSRLTTFLMSTQYDKYYGSEEATARTKARNKQRLDEWNAKKKAQEMQEKMKGMSRAQRLDQGADEVDPDEEEDLSQPPKDVAEEFDSDFSFAQPFISSASGEEIEELLSSVKNCVDESLQNALRRGIAMHHEALPRDYRVAVEQLFRLGYVRICITGTSLSLGVNMPCRTAVFAGDHITLTPTLFKQTSGRSGRRGYDALGNVVFWEFSMGKMRRLMGSQLTRLTGEWPIDPTFVCREANIVAQAEDQILQDFKLKFQTMAAKPLSLVNYLDGNDEEKDAKLIDHYSTVSSIGHDITSELLNELNFLEGSLPAGFNSMLVKLFEQKPDNLHLAWLLNTGVVHRFVREMNKGDSVSSQDMVRGFIWILSKVFRRQSHHAAIVQMMRFNSSVGVLHEHLEDLFADEETVNGISALDKFNKIILDSSVDYIKRVGKTIGGFTDDEFELSELGISMKGSSDSSDLELVIPGLETLDDELRMSLNPFATATGTGDMDRATRTQLIAGKRLAIPLEKSMIKTYEWGHVLSVHKTADTEGWDMFRSYNSDYINAFMTDPTLKNIIVNHSIDPSAAWYLLREWVDMFINVKQLFREQHRLTNVSDAVMQLMEESGVVLERNFTVAQDNL